MIIPLSGIPLGWSGRLFSVFFCRFISHLVPELPPLRPIFVRWGWSVFVALAKAGSIHLPVGVARLGGFIGMLSHLSFHSGQRLMSVQKASLKRSSETSYSIDDTKNRHQRQRGKPHPLSGYHRWQRTINDEHVGMVGERSQCRNVRFRKFCSNQACNRHLNSRSFGLIYKM